MRTKKDRAATFKQAEKFEKRVRDFLEKIGFSDVSGGPGFKFGNSSQIDACGGAGKTLVVVDAHASVEQRRKSIRSKIKALRGERPLIIRGMHRLKAYKKYRDVRLVVAARRVKFTQQDRNFASISPRVYLWDDQVLNYYSRLSNLTGPYAKNDLLGELDVPVTSTIPENKMTVPAIRTSLRGRTVYLFFAKPDVLLATSYVARREKGKEQHYQRLFDKSRLGQIGIFLNDRRKRGFFANNVILNFLNRPSFRTLSGASPARGLQLGTLHFPKAFRSAWIIDGQHRLYGFTKAGQRARDLLLPVIGFQGLNTNKQAELFLEINRNQKAVPPDLIWDLEAEINPNSEYGVISNAVKQLNLSGPLGGMISIPFEGRKRNQHIKLGNICDGVLNRGLADEQTESMKARERNPLFDRSGRRQTDKLSKALKEFFSCCSTSLRKDWVKGRDGFFCTNNGINVLLRVYERALSYHSRKPSKAELTRVLRVIQKWLNDVAPRKENLEELRRSTSSEGGRADLAEKLSQVIATRLELKGFAVGNGGESGISKKASELERRLARFISDRMEERYGPDWVRTRTPDGLKKAQERRRSSTKPIEQFLTLGECMPIILREDNWSDIFKKTFGNTFHGKDGFKVKFEELLNIRNTAVHRPSNLTERDSQLFDIYQRDLDNCMRMRKKSTTGLSTAPA